MKDNGAMSFTESANTHTAHRTRPISTTCATAEQGALDGGAMHTVTVGCETCGASVTAHGVEALTSCVVEAFLFAHGDNCTAP